MTIDETAVADATQAAAGDATLRDQVIDALRTVYDPEIPVNIYELGLIYDIAIDENGAVAIEMTLTAPGCPVAGSMPGTVQEAVSAVPGVSKVDVELVWDPPWDQSRMSEAAQLELGMF
jgi:FeS assembly SUF system protein